MQFHSSGKLGDIVYTLPIVRSLIKGGVPIGRGHYVHKQDGIDSFLLSQPYIGDVSRARRTVLNPEYVNFDKACYLPTWTREHFIYSYMRVTHTVFESVNLSPWIEGYDKTPNGYAVINVTDRYRDKFFSWKSEVSRLKGKYNDVYFVGSRQEFTSFPYRSGLKYQYTTDVKELCAVIAGANEFSGNQSLALALRQGLGLPYRFEQSPNHEDVIQHSKIETVLNPLTRKAHLLGATLRRILSTG